MNNKEKFYNSFIENNDRLNEIELGECLGFSEDETRSIIAQLLDENKIVFSENGKWDYTLAHKQRGS